MAKLVINSTVKKEWRADRWLQTSATGRKEPIFILACVDYQTPKGTVPVFFNPYVAWVHADDAGVFTFGEIKDFLKGGIDYSFPDNYDEYRPVLRAGSDEEFDMHIVSEFGLEEFLDDIRERLLDLAPYGEEVEIDPRSM